MHFPKSISYGIMPLCFVLIVIRIIPDIRRLWNEKESEIGASKPTLDMEKLEAEAAANRAAAEAKGARQ
jgi:TRAP-type C4-dicarboxylate transport system permease small subunit